MPEPENPDERSASCHKRHADESAGRRRSLMSGNQLVRLAAPLMIAGIAVLGSRLGKKLSWGLKCLVAFGLVQGLQRHGRASLPPCRKEIACCPNSGLLATGLGCNLLIGSAGCKGRTSWETACIRGLCG